MFLCFSSVTRNSSGVNIKIGAYKEEDGLTSWYHDKKVNFLFSYTLHEIQHILILWVQKSIPWYFVVMYTALTWLIIKNLLQFFYIYSVFLLTGAIWYVWYILYAVCRGGLWTNNKLKKVTMLSNVCLSPIVKFVMGIVGY